MFIVWKFIYLFFFKKHDCLSVVTSFLPDYFVPLELLDYQGNNSVCKTRAWDEIRDICEEYKVNINCKTDYFTVRHSQAEIWLK